MTLQIETLVCGPLENNVYIVFDENSHEAVIFDPSFEPEKILRFLEKKKLALIKILITHSHFDHFIGVADLARVIDVKDAIYLHRDDLDLWQSGGGSKIFLGKDLEVISPTNFVTDEDKILFGGHEFEVRHSPGHSSGSVIYYLAEQKSAFVGDVIFYHSIGRTDLNGGNQMQLLNSIRSKVFTLPPDTILYPGHGPSTSVSEEMQNNPYL